MPTLGEMNDIAQSNGPTTVMQHAATLAQTQQQVEQQKAQTEQLQQQMDQGKWDSFQKRAGLALAAPKTVQGKMFDQLGQWMDKNAMDGTIAHALKDEDFQAQFIKAQHWNSKNPIEAADGVQALSSLGTFQPAVQTLAEKSASLQEATTLKQAQIEANKSIAGGHDSAKVQAAGISAMGGAKTESMLDRVQRKIVDDPTIVQYSKTSDLLENARGILARPTLTVQDFNDVQKEFSNAMAGARNSAIGNLARTEYETYEGDFKKWATKVTGQPSDQVPPEIKQHLEEVMSQIHDNILTHRYARAKALKRTSQNPEVNRTQEEAIANFMHDSPAAANQQPSAQGAVPAQQAPASLSANQQAFVAKAKALKNPQTGQPYTDAEIQQKMQQKGIR